MKTLGRILSIVVIIMSVSLFPFPAEAQDDVKYIGEVCYTLDEDSALSGIALPMGRLGILSFGPDYFILSGRGSMGTAVLSGNTIKISLNHSADSYSSDGSMGATWFSAMYMVVDAQTLKGTHTTMIVQTKPEPPKISTHKGSARLYSCGQ